MDEEAKIIYTDGRRRVEAHPETVTFADETQDATITFSHAAMREIVLNWGRFREREDEEHE